MHLCVWPTGLAQGVMVIYEVPHTDSDMEEMEKHSTYTSTGSSHWASLIGVMFKKKHHTDFI